MDCPRPIKSVLRSIRSEGLGLRLELWYKGVLTFVFSCRAWFMMTKLGRIRTNLFCVAQRLANDC